jgi:hypothetical protein
VPALIEVFGQRFEDSAEDPFSDPLLKAAVAGLVGWVTFRQILPGSAGAKYPEDAV